MISKYSRVILFSLFALSVACAQPNYVEPIEVPANPNQKADACMAKFTSGYCVSFEWEKVPTEEEFGSFTFKTFSEGPAPVFADLSSVVAVVIWMPSMGHGASPVKVDRLGVGIYRASNVFFTMKGDWEIRFQLKEGADVKDQAFISLTL